MERRGKWKTQGEDRQDGNEKQTKIEQEREEGKGWGLRNRE